MLLHVQWLLVDGQQSLEVTIVRPYFGFVTKKIEKNPKLLKTYRQAIKSGSQETEEFAIR